MDQDVFNLELRKFLKRFGVTAQHQIEKAVETALRERKLVGNEILPVTATLGVPGVLPKFDISGEIALAGEGPFRKALSSNGSAKSRRLELLGEPVRRVLRQQLVLEGVTKSRFQRYVRCGGG